MKQVNESNFNRLARGIMEFYDIPYEQAVSRLESFKLQLICDETIRESVSLQAALLTAMNAGRRAYHGGVSVLLPDKIESLLPWPEKKTLNEIIAGYEDVYFVSTEHILTDKCSSLFFGNTYKSNNGLRVICDGWRGGVVPADENITFCQGNDFALGGVFAGGLAVSQAFLQISGLDCFAGRGNIGMSLWEPEMNWLENKSAGPNINSFPEKLWIIGLGHLGQAYLWTLGLLKHLSDYMPTILLQDYDIITEANWISGMLCKKSDSGIKKTRLCAEWLEQRGFHTTIVERAFDKNILRVRNEPYVALCGVDKEEPRKLLENAGFDLVIEAGLGGEVEDFDRIIMHTFPNTTRPASETWNTSDNKDRKPHKRISELTEIQNGCGILAETLSNKAISTAFVGTVAASLVIGELLKSLHNGKRIKAIHMKLRDILNNRLLFFPDRYTCEVARNGFYLFEAKIV